MSELHEVRKKLLDVYDNLVSITLDPTDHTEGMLSGLRLSIDAISQAIYDEEKRIAKEFEYGKISEL